MKKPTKPPRPRIKVLAPRATPPAAPPVSAAPTVMLEKLARAMGMGQTSRRVTKEEVDRARELAERKGDDQLRILIDLMWLTGARISEVLALQVKDIDFGAKIVSMPTLKRRGATVPKRGIPLPISFLGPLVSYLSKHKLQPDAPLIGWRRTKGWEALHEILLEAGVDPGRAFPHAFRHGHALHALKNGVPINIVQYCLGHTSVLTTQIYVRATGQDIAHSYDRVDW